MGNRTTVPRAISATLLAVIAGLAAAACSSGGSSPALPACAEQLPVPEAVEVVEVTATPSADNPTCAVTLASTEPVDDVAAAWERVLDEAGITYAAQQQPGQQTLLRLEGPVCGSVLVFAAGTERVTDAVAADRTPVLASIADCPER
jgi:hypothetical protein